MKPHLTPLIFHVLDRRSALVLIVLGAFSFFLSLFFENISLYLNTAAVFLLGVGIAIIIGLFALEA